MRRAARFVLLSLFGVVTTVATYLVGLVVMPATALSADTHSATTQGCVLNPDTAALHAPVLPMTQQRPAAGSTNGSSHGASHGSGAVVAGIPGAVFVRVVGHELVVTTNTGKAPQRNDTYYYVRNHHAGLADLAVIGLVRRTCG